MGAADTMTDTTEVTDPAVRATDTAVAHVERDPEWVATLRERLLAHAFLFDDPRGYEAGVEDTLAEVAAVLSR